MWVADMDFEAPPEVLDALRDRIRHGVLGYSVPTEEVVDAVLRYLKREHQWEVDPSWLVWTPGLVPALNLLARAVGSDGDAIMTCTPVYPPFLTAPRQSGRALQAVPLQADPSGRWTMDFEAMEAAVTDRTRLFFQCNPQNPTGRVYSERELRQLADFCQRHDLVISSDEIHCDLVLGPHPHRVLAVACPEVSHRTVTLMAPSKTYNLPGLSCAFLIIPDPGLRASFKRAAAGIITEINVFGYVGCAAAFDHAAAWHADLLRYLRANWEFLDRFFRENLPALTVARLEATYLAWIDVRSLPCQDPVAHFESHGLGLSDGRFFGCPGFVRLNFGCPRSVLEEGLGRFLRAATGLSSGNC